MGSTSSSITSLKPRPHHHLDEHPRNRATTSTSGNNPSPHEPVAQATETVAPWTRLQSSRSSSQTSTPSPKTTATSCKTHVSQWAVFCSQYPIPPAGRSSQKLNFWREIEKEKTTASPAQTTHFSPPSSRAKPSCPPSTSTRIQTPTPPQHTHPPPISSKEHHHSHLPARKTFATPQNYTNQPPSSSSPTYPSARQVCTGSSSGL